MTTRIKGFVVALDTDIREDDAEHIKNAILTLKNVISVKIIDADSLDDYIIKGRERTRIFNRMRDVIFENITSEQR